MANRLQQLVQQFRYRVGLDRPRDIAAAVGLRTPTLAGSSINAESSLAISTVYACVYKIASTMSSLGLGLYAVSGRNREKLTAHPAYRSVAVSPNSEVTPFIFWETIVADACLRGCGYAMIERDNVGRVAALHIIPSEQVQRTTIKGRTMFKLHDGMVIDAEDMLEISNLYNMSPIQLHRENLGLAMSAQEYGSQYFANGGQMTGVLSSEQPLKNEQIEVVQQSWNASSSNAGTKLLPFGFKYQRIGIPPEEAQFIETRKFQAEEICRIFSVPPALVQLESQTTYNNVEQQNLMFARHTVTPWAKRIEQELNRKLLTTFEQENHYFKFELNDLFRGDMAARSNFYTQMLQNGVFSINECRMNEEMNPISGGDQHLVQVNQLSLDKMEAYSEKLTSSDTNTSTDEPE
jgi:HK97 family phage portal protein